MKSTRGDLAPIRTIEVTTKVIIEVQVGPTDIVGNDLAEQMGTMALEAMLRGDAITFTPYH